MKKYDGLYIFAGAAKEESVETLIEKASAEITRLSGKVLRAESLGKKTFARTMQKRDGGLYVKIRFTLAPAQIATLRERYLLLEDFFRVQILAVDERREAILAKQAADQKAREAFRAEAAAKAADEAQERRGQDEE